jgi:predicted dehydrogenase/nucleoside-diphosphate-sugar epimerase
MTTPLRVSFIGGGEMARHHLHAIRRLRVAASVVGVFDRVPEMAQQFAALAGAPAFPSVGELLATAQPDVVHVCTPPAAHFDAAYAALESGAHVYVEKPFALTTTDARRLLELAAARNLLVCAGHQLLRDRAFESLTRRIPVLGSVVQADSHFAFRPPGASAARRGACALARQTIDILPHPLYTLVSVLERCAPDTAIQLSWVHGGPSDLRAVLTAGDVVGRLSVSLRARPVASSLTITGTRGSLACDFVRSIVVGAGNMGTSAIEKAANPFVEGLQLVSRTAISLARRFGSGSGYPGLADLIESFYRAIEARGVSPVSPDHLLRVTSLFEQLAAVIEASAPRARSTTRTARTARTPSIVVTGAGGFLGTAVASALGEVRGIGRASDPGNANVADWIAADLSQDALPPRALEGAGVVVHAASETSGGYDAHQRNTIDGTRHLLRAMHAAGLTRLVLVSSLSVLRPPRTPWERQHEATPRPLDPRRFGPYVWGKSLQEELVAREAPTLGIETRIVRPGALVDWSEPALPGLMGRHLLGRWHLGLGRPGLPIAVCDVRRAADAIAWCATHFDDAPPVVNLIAPELPTRRAVVERLRKDGWDGRIVWIPISVVSIGIVTVRTVLALLHGRWPQTLAAWSILRPRYYDARVAAAMLHRSQASVADAAVHV